MCKNLAQFLPHDYHDCNEQCKIVFKCKRGQWRQIGTMAETCNESLNHREDNESEKPAKIARFDVDNEQKEIHNITSLKNFRFLRILSNDVNSKSICIQGKYKEGEQPEVDALLRLEKSPFDERSVEKYLTEATKLELSFQNDVYCQYIAMVDPELNNLKAVTIMPATERHVLKFTHQEYYVVNETPKDYDEITLPYIEKNQHSLQWVRNIIDHKAEVDRIVFEDEDPETGFILLPDLKWNEKQVTDLHLTAFVLQRELRSLRDLRKEHLPLLKNILVKGREAAKERYKVNPDQLRVFVHYYPSYYHLHIHFQSTASVSATCAIGKAHFLNEIIDNIENVDGNYYQKKTLSLVIGTQDPLLCRYLDKGRILKTVLE